MGVGAIFGQVIRNMRKERGLSQEALALQCGLDRTFISLLERGLRQPSLSTILVLAFCLQISPGLLVSQVEEKLPDDFYKKIWRAVDMGS